MVADKRGPRRVGIAIIGAGFAGIGLAVRLREAGLHDFVILERAEDLGGTWRANTYPGCACDVPSALYSYSFAPNPQWSRRYGTQSEILDYLRRVATEHAVPRHIEFGAELLDARWDERENHWRLRTGRGELVATILISAVGPFAEAQIPSIPGREVFAGTQFHSLHWDHDHDLTGRRVAVVGTGASAVQFIPEIQPKVQQLTVFQRSAPWIIPRMDWTAGRLGAALRRRSILGKAERGAYFAAIESFGLVGFVHRRFRHPFEALGRFQLRRQVRDRALRRRLTPDYVIGCKRAIFSDAYYPALTQPNVDVVTTGISRIEANAVVTTDGVTHPVDTIIWGTGFALPPAVFDTVHSTDGVSLARLHQLRPSAYLGVTVAGFPNAFLTLGPFGAAGNQSAVFMIEAQIRYIVDALLAMRERGIQRLEVRRDVQDEFVREMEHRSRETVWLTGGCRSYYTTPDGASNSGLYPDWSFNYARRTRSFDIAAYRVGTHSSVDVVAESA